MKRASLFFIILVIFVSLIYAGPHGGPSGGSGGGGGSGRSPGGNFGAPSGGRETNIPSGSGGTSRSSEKPSTPKENNEPGSGNQPVSNGSPKNKDNSNSSIGNDENYNSKKNNETNPTENSQNTYNFRGQRVAPNNSDIEVTNSLSMPENDGSSKIIVHFNQSINPLSIKKENILINGKTPDDNLEFIYNKKVDTMSFNVDAEEITSLELVNIESSDGKKIESLKINIRSKK